MARSSNVSGNPTAARAHIGRTTAYPPEVAREKFLKRYAQCGNVTDACKVARINRDTAYAWRQSDLAFALAWDGAREQAADALEKEAWRRAVKGWDEEAYSAGIAVGTVHRYSDRLLEVLLKATRPEKYRENIKISGGVTAQLHVSITVQEMRARILTQLQDQPETLDLLAGLLDGEVAS